MSTYQCVDFFYKIDDIKIFKREKHFFTFYSIAFIKKKKHIFLIIKMPAKKKQERNLPQIKTQQIWRNDYLWLDFSNNRMKCLLCCEWEKIIEQSKNFNDKFIVDCINYRISAVKDHAKSDKHLKSIKQKDKKNSEEAGETHSRKVTLSTPQNSATVNSLNRASVKEK